MLLLDHAMQQRVKKSSTVKIQKKNKNKSHNTLVAVIPFFLFIKKTEISDITNILGDVSFSKIWRKIFATAMWKKNVLICFCNSTYDVF